MPVRPDRSELERLAEAELRAAEAMRSRPRERIRHLDRAAEYATLAEIEDRRSLQERDDPSSSP